MPIDSHPIQFSSVDFRFGQVQTVFFGLGAQKAGSTWLHRYLQSHPDTATPALKETTYWNFVESGRPHSWTRQRADRFGAGNGLLPTMLRWIGSPFPSLQPKEMVLLARMLDEPTDSHDRYADLLFTNYSGQAAIGEICPNYALLQAETLAKMNALADDVRFFYVMRDPVSRTLSWLKMGTQRGWINLENGTSLEVVLETVLNEGEQSFSLASSRYDKIITCLETAVPRERIHYMFYEALFDQKTVDGLTDFLRIRRHPARTNSRVLRGRGAEDQPKPEQVARLREALSPTYEFVVQRFGHAVPKKWRF